jgi:hypothetical protein
VGHLAIGVASGGATAATVQAAPRVMALLRMGGDRDRDRRDDRNHFDPNQIDLDNLKFSRTVENHIYARALATGRLERPYGNSRFALEDILSSGTPLPDPRGTPGAFRWDVPGSLNGAAGTFELVIHVPSNTVLHFLFKGHWQWGDLVLSLVLAVPPTLLSTAKRHLVSSWTTHQRLKTDHAFRSHLTLLRLHAT